jgi:hypothetical protein
MREQAQRFRRVLALTCGAATMLALAVVPPAHALPPADVPAVGVDTGRFKLPIGCDIFLGGVKIWRIGTDVDVQGVAPVQVGPGQEFWLTQGSGSITFPSWLTALAGIIAVNKVDAKITDLSIGASTSTPANINIAKDAPFEIKDIALTPGQPLKVGLPLSGTFDVGPFTAAQSGATTLQFNGAVAEVNLRSSAGFTIPIKADCKASKGNALLKLGIGGPTGQPPAKITGAPLNFDEPASNELVGIIHAPYTCKLNGDTLDVGIAVGAHIPLVVTRAGSFAFTKGLRRTDPARGGGQQAPRQGLHHGRRQSHRPEPPRRRRHSSGAERRRRRDHHPDHAAHPGHPHHPVAAHRRHPDRRPVQADRDRQERRGLPGRGLRQLHLQRLDRHHHRDLRNTLTHRLPRREPRHLTTEWDPRAAGAPPPKVPAQARPPANLAVPRLCWSGAPRAWCGRPAGRGRCCSCSPSAEI